MVSTSAIERESPLDAVQRIRPVIEQHRDEGERERRLPDAIVRAMRDADLFKQWTPREYGGSEVDLPVFMETVEEISRIDGASGWTYVILAAGPLMTAFLAPEHAREILANGPNTPIAGSVIPNGRAVPVDGGYRLNGRWPLASGCHFGDWLGMTALIFDGDTPRMDAHGAPDFQAAFVQREDCQILDTWHSVGLRGTGSTDVAISDVLVPAGRMFSEFTAAPQASGALYKLGPLALFSMAIVPVLLGIAREAIDVFVELARSKTPTLSQTGLATRPTIHADVARAEALLQSTRAYLYEVADELMTAVRSTGSVPESLEARRRLACVNAGANCPKVVDMVFALAGSTPVYSGHRLERCLRDIHTASQHLLVSPVWWEKTGQHYFGQGLGMP